MGKVFDRANAYPISSPQLGLFWLPHVLCKISITAIYCDTDYTKQLMKRDHKTKKLFLGESKINPKLSFIASMSEYSYIYTENIVQCWNNLSEKRTSRRS